MAVSTRSKRVTDPLNDRVKALLTNTDHFQFSYISSSGSEHSADQNTPSSLSELVHGFLETESQQTPSSPITTTTTTHDPDPDLIESCPDRTVTINETLTSINANNVNDSYRNILFSHVCKAIEKFSFLRSDKSLLRRNVMAVLRELGHNAAVCKTKWNSSGGLSSGNYEFIDVLRSTCGKGQGQQIRYFVEVDLVEEFEIARPTGEYSRMMECLPRVFVGTGEELMRVVRVLCEAARRSLRSRELSVSPWRKNRYMQNKWFGPYRRTVNLVTEKKSLAPGIMESAGGGVVIKPCVGFDDVVSEGDINVNRQLFVRTR